MTQADDAADLSVDDAVATIERAQAFVEPLRRRTEGMTWFVWGAVTFGAAAMPAVVPSSIADYDAGGWRRLVDTTLWVPWLVLGLLGTRALTRITNVRLRGHDLRIAWSARGTWMIVASLVVIWVLFTFVVSSASAAVAVLFVGSIWLALGGIDPYGATPQGRRTLILIGLFVMAGAVAFYAITRASHASSWEHMPLALGLTGGLVPMIGGLVQALRG